MAYHISTFVLHVTKKNIFIMSHFIPSYVFVHLNIDAVVKASNGPGWQAAQLWQTKLKMAKKVPNLKIG